MAEAMLIGAGLGAGTSMISGKDPLQGAVIGGAMGGATAGFGNAGVQSGVSAGASNGASHLSQTGLQQATASGTGLGATIGSGFDTVKDATGLTNRDMSMMAINQGMNAMQPTQQQPIQHAPVNISQPQVDLSQGTSAMNSNPRIKKLKMQGLI